MRLEEVRCRAIYSVPRFGRLCMEGFRALRVGGGASAIGVVC